MEKSKQLIRSSSHAGSWYSNDPVSLKKELQSYLSKANKQPNLENLKGLISPHAGYAYSGPTAAWSYINIDPQKFKRVVLLGPSHHIYLSGCGLTKCESFETPLGNISIDKESINNLAKIKWFTMLDVDDDENEHSLEMQLPYLRLMFGEKDFKLLPIMVGQTNLEYDRYFAKVLLDYYKDPETLFVISSDFCHWGKRFGYTYYDKNFPTIWESIEDLDKKGMKEISSLSAEKFNKYLSEYKNTICGCKPISLFLSIIEEFNKDSSNKNSIEFVQYAQSEKINKASGSSVSYAAGVNTLL